MTTEQQQAYPVANFDPEDDPEIHHDHWTYFDNLRRHGPAFFNPAGDGIWVVTERQGIATALADDSRFSSVATSGIKKKRIPPAERLIPVQLDRPEHTIYRKLLNPHFAPQKVGQQRESVRRRCVELVDSIAGKDEVEFMAEFAQQFPTVIFLDMVGFPVERTHELLEWSIAVQHTTAAEDPTGKVRSASTAKVHELIAECIEQHRSGPRDDIIGHLLEARIEDRPLTDAELHNMLMLLYIAGLDTVVGTLGYVFHFLAVHPDQRARIIAEGKIIPTAVEEFLRYFSTVALTRTLRQDMEFSGCPMKAGDKVFLPLACANRDPDAEPDAGEVRLDRSPNRHLAFGLGPHRCLGSHLARMELAIALEEWHKRIPEYWLAPDADLTERVGGTACFKELRLTLGRP